MSAIDIAQSLTCLLLGGVVIQHQRTIARLVRAEARRSAGDESFRKTMELIGSSSNGPGFIRDGKITNLRVVDVTLPFVPEWNAESMARAGIRFDD